MILFQDFNSIQENQVGFSVQKFVGATAVWINQHELAALPGTLDQEPCFIDRFSYAVRDVDCFQSLEFDPTKNKDLLAERYGGRGIGDNGGGARCGNDGIFQLKGVGPNVLVGSGKNVMHSYGGLTLVSAVYEALVSVVFGGFLPIGVAKVYGVISTAKECAFSHPICPINGPSKVAGAILVREACDRPAHILRAGGFVYDEKSGKKLDSDVERIKNIYKKIGLANQGDFIAMLGKFLSGCANQLAFSQVCRISHGNLSPSNLCMDGRWLDLSRLRILSAGENVAEGGGAYFDNKMDPIKTIEEIAYTYIKYNKIPLNHVPLVDYYLEQFEAYYAFHLPFFFVLGSGDVDLEYMSSIGKPLLELCNAVFRENPEPTHGKEASVQESLERNEDRSVELLRFLFSGYLESQSNFETLAQKCESNCESIRLTFIDILRAKYMSLNADGLLSFKSVSLSAAVVAFRRSYLSCVFGYQPLLKAVSQACEAGSVDALIDQYKSLFSWVFSKNDLENPVIFMSDSAVLSFHPITEKVVLEQNSIKLEFQTFSECSEQLLQREDLFYSNDIDFAPYAQQALSFLHTVAFELEIAR